MGNSEISATSDVDWLEAWYIFWCDEDWEHQYGITFGTSPTKRGWTLEADLADTQFENRPWDGFHAFRRKDDWIQCGASPMKYEAEGGLWNLAEMVEGFRQWSQ